MFYTDKRQEIQPGDRVSVRLLGAGVQTRGEVFEVYDNFVTVNTSWGYSRLTIFDGGSWQIAQQSIPIPTKKNAVIKIDGRIYIRTKPDGDQPWQEAGRNFIQSDMAVQAGADRYGHEVIFEGRDE